MNARYLIDDVCLWCARLFAIWFAGFIGYLFFLFLPSRIALYTLDDIRIRLAACFTVLAILWVLSLWNLRHASARLFLGASAALFLGMLAWEYAEDTAVLGWTFTLMLFGIPCMVWVAIRPPVKNINSRHA